MHRLFLRNITTYQLACDRLSLSQALEFYLIAVQLTPKDGETWKRVAQVAKEIGQLRQAVLCYHHAAQLLPKDHTVQWERAIALSDHVDILAEEAGRGEGAPPTVEVCKKAMDALDSALSLVDDGVRSGPLAVPGSTERVDLAVRAARLGHTYAHHVSRLSGMLMLERVLGECLDQAPGEVDLSAVNILMELYLDEGKAEREQKDKKEKARSKDKGEKAKGMEGSVEFAKGVALIDKLSSSRPAAAERLPLDLTAKYAVCQIYCGRSIDVARHLQELLEEKAKLRIAIPTEPAAPCSDVHEADFWSVLRLSATTTCTSRWPRLCTTRATTHRRHSPPPCRSVC